MTNTKRETLLPGSAAICTAAALLLPKCPLCIAAYLSLLGAGTSLAGVVAQALRPTLIGMALLLVGVASWRWLLHRRRAAGRQDVGADSRDKRGAAGCHGRVKAAG